MANRYHWTLPPLKNIVPYSICLASIIKAKEAFFNKTDDFLQHVYGCYGYHNKTLLKFSRDYLVVLQEGVGITSGRPNLAALPSLNGGARAGSVPDGAPWWNLAALVISPACPTKTNWPTRFVSIDPAPAQQPYRRWWMGLPNLYLIFSRDLYVKHEDVMTWKLFPCDWTFPFTKRQ